VLKHQQRQRPDCDPRPEREPNEVRLEKQLAINQNAAQKQHESSNPNDQGATLVSRKIRRIE
jgi:hypothetical protein